MEWLYDKPLAQFAALVANVRHDPLPWAVASVLAAFALIGLSVLELIATHRRLRRLERVTREHVEHELRAGAEHRQEVSEHLRAAHYYLRELNDKLGSTLPPDVQVGSIKAENLVVQPAGDRLSR